MSLSSKQGETSAFTNSGHSFEAPLTARSGHRVRKKTPPQWAGSFGQVLISDDRSPPSSGSGLIQRDHQGAETSGERVFIGVTLGFMSYSAFSSQVDPGLDQVGMGGAGRARYRRDE